MSASRAGEDGGQSSGDLQAGEPVLPAPQVNLSTSETRGATSEPQYVGGQAFWWRDEVAMVQRLCQRLWGLVKRRSEQMARFPLIVHCAFMIIFCWFAGRYQVNLALVFTLAVLYFAEVVRVQRERLVHKIRHEERKAANQRRPMSDVETVRWLNAVMERTWPIWAERFLAQEVLTPFAPWFFEKYKPWHVKRAILQRLYLGSTPPLVATARTIPSPGFEDHVILEVTGEFVVSEDMYAVVAGQPRFRLGLGMWATFHMSQLIVEGKMRVGVKFLPEWPFVSRLRLCFAGVPYVSVKVHPIVNFGIDVAGLPGIAGWLDRVLATALENCMVEPNMLVVDVQKLVAHYMPRPGAGLQAPANPSEFVHVTELPPCASVLIEILEAAEVKAADSNGFSDPYVKVALGSARFKTRVQRRTLHPQWFEEFCAPICSWSLPNLLVLRVRDKDTFKSDELGYCVVDLNQEKYKTGQRYEFWEILRRVKTGRLHIAITVTLNEKPPAIVLPADPKQYTALFSGTDGSKQGPGSADVGPMGMDGKAAPGISPAPSRERPSLYSNGSLSHWQLSGDVAEPPGAAEREEMKRRGLLGTQEAEGGDWGEGAGEEAGARLMRQPMTSPKRREGAPGKRGGSGKSTVTDVEVLSLDYLAQGAEPPAAATERAIPEWEGEEPSIRVPAHGLLGKWFNPPSGKSSGSLSSQPSRHPSPSCPRTGSNRSMSSCMSTPGRSPAGTPGGSPLPTPPRSPLHMSWSQRGASKQTPESSPSATPRRSSEALAKRCKPEEEEWTDEDGADGITPPNEPFTEDSGSEPEQWQPPVVWPKNESLREMGGKEGRVKDEAEPIDVGIEPFGFLTCVRPGEAVAEASWKGRAGGRRSEAAAMAGFWEGEGRKSRIEQALESLTRKTRRASGNGKAKEGGDTWREEEEVALDDVHDDEKRRKKGKNWLGLGKKKKRAAAPAPGHEDDGLEGSSRTLTGTRSETALSPGRKEGLDVGLEEPGKRGGL